jgi:hypothetical protein
MSKGAALNRSPTAATSEGATNRNTAPGSTKRRISQGQAMRSILGLARVTQTVRPFASRGGSLSAGTSGSFEAFQASNPPSSVSASALVCRSQAAVPCASFSPRWQTTTADCPANSEPQFAASSCLRLTAPGMSRGSAAKSLSVRTSIRAGERAVPISRTSLSGDIVVKEDMIASSLKRIRTRCLGVSPHGEIAGPPREYYSGTAFACQCA